MSKRKLLSVAVDHLSSAMSHVDSSEEGEKRRKKEDDEDVENAGSNKEREKDRESRSRSRSSRRRRRESTSRSRSHSRRKHKKKRKSKHHRRHRQHSSSSSSSSSSSPKRRSSSGSDKIARMISQSLEKNLASFQQRLGLVPGGSKENESALQDQKKRLQQLEIESKANSLGSPGAQSQYRAMANIQLKISYAVEALDDFLLSTSSSPDDDIHKGICPVKEILQNAIADASLRMYLIGKADANPKHGWKAITVYEEKQRQEINDPEKEKDFNQALKKVQDADKKKPSTSSKSFRFPPGSSRNSGSSSSSGVIFCI